MSEVLYFLFIGVLFYAMMRWGCGAHMMGGGHGGGHGDHAGGGSGEKKAQSIKDPVCGMELDARTAEFSERYRGGLFYFCSDKCRGQFKQDPDRYTKAA